MPATAGFNRVIGITTAILTEAGIKYIVVKNSPAITAVQNNNEVIIISVYCSPNVEIDGYLEGLRELLQSNPGENCNNRELQLHAVPVYRPAHAATRH